MLALLYNNAKIRCFNFCVLANYLANWWEVNGEVRELERGVANKVQQGKLKTSKHGGMGL